LPSVGAKNSDPWRAIVEIGSPFVKRAPASLMVKVEQASAEPLNVVFRRIRHDESAIGISPARFATKPK
jgi:hypothetical protein